MKIGGLQKLTLLDYPGHVACTLFTVGCNFRCPFCHNSPLITNIPNEEVMKEEEFFTFLTKRKGILDGVAITGGEPLLQPDIIDFIQKIRNCGYEVKLDTNGSKPKVLKDLLDQKLVDYVAMDIKNSKAKLATTIGTEKYVDEMMESIHLLMNGSIPFEFRTTAVKDFHESEDFEEIGKMIQGTSRYFIQCFKDSGLIYKEGLSSPSVEDMQAYLNAVLPYVPTAEVRGVDL